MGLIIHNLLMRLSGINQLSEKAIIEYLDESSRTWESCILASSKWTLHDQRYLVAMLDDFKKYLSVISSRYHRNCY